MEPLPTLLTLLAGAFGGYLVGYMRKKGENLATHEDIGKLTDQVTAVTKTAKEIEAKISSDMWDRQKRWELKREVLFEATRRVAEVDDALLSYDSMLQLERRKEVSESAAWVESKLEVLTRWSQASTAFDQTKLLVSIVCGKETREAFDALWAIVTRLGAAMSKDADLYRTVRPDFVKKLSVVRDAIRKELGIDPSDPPPSSGPPSL